jgi:hypothetical protein
MEREDIERLYADLGGMPEIAQALGVSVFRVKRWIYRRDAVCCPMPVRALKGNNVYSIAEWKGWFALWRVTRGSETWHRRARISD